MHMYGSRKGTGVIPLVVFVILWAGAAVLAYVTREDYTKEREEVRVKKLEELAEGETVRQDYDWEDKPSSSNRGSSPRNTPASIRCVCRVFMSTVLAVVLS